MRLVGLCVIVLCGVCSGCITPPKVGVQQPIASDSLGLSPPTATAGVPVRNWWTGFNDPQFDHLMQLTLAQNPSLAQAMARVREAQSLADVARSGLLPALDFNGHETRERLSGHDPIPKPYPGTTQWQGRAGVDLSWDLDFWGRQQSLVKQARSQTTAAALDVASARLALSGAVAQAYIDLNRDNALADVAQRTEAQRRNILEITRRRVQ